MFGGVFADEATAEQDYQTVTPATTQTSSIYQAAVIGKQGSGKVKMCTVLSEPSSVLSTNPGSTAPALVAFIAADAGGGSGFIATFVAGLAYGNATRDRPHLPGGAPRVIPMEIVETLSQMARVLYYQGCEYHRSRPSAWAS